MALTIMTRATTHAVATWWGRGPLPIGAEAVGVVSRSPTDRGLLLRMPTGIYAQGNAGALRTLPQREVRETLGDPPLVRGRPATIGADYMLRVRMPRALYDLIAECARREGVNVSEYVRAAARRATVETARRDEPG